MICRCWKFFFGPQSVPSSLSPVGWDRPGGPGGWAEQMWLSGCSGPRLPLSLSFPLPFLSLLFSPPLLECIDMEFKGVFGTSLGFPFQVRAGVPGGPSGVVGMMSAEYCQQGSRILSRRRLCLLSLCLLVFLLGRSPRGVCSGVDSTNQLKRWK